MNTSVWREQIGESSLNNVHEPRNAEFTVFLGSFLVE